MSAANCGIEQCSAMRYTVRLCWMGQVETESIPTNSA